MWQKIANLGERCIWMLNHIILATFLKVQNFLKFKKMKNPS